MNSIYIEKTGKLNGEVKLSGAKNAVLVEIAALLLINGISKLYNVPFSNDVYVMCQLLKDVGANVVIEEEKGTLTVDSTNLTGCSVNAEYMKKMRASILVLGPLLALFLRARVALPGGCVLGARPIDYHIKNFQKMGVSFQFEGEYLIAHTPKLKAVRTILEYPSVGATENIIMAAVLTEGTTTIINAALEPEVLDLIKLLKAAGAEIEINAPATISVTGVSKLKAVEHSVMLDRLEAGTYLLSAAVSGGTIYIPEIKYQDLDVFLLKLEEMGHIIESDERGIKLIANPEPQAVSFKTSPFPGFPTDLQAPMIVAQCLAKGKSTVEETVFENRLLHCSELNKMGANIKVSGSVAMIEGVKSFVGTAVNGMDIRAAAALVIAGTVAEGSTMVYGLNHIRRGYSNFDIKLNTLGAKISFLNQI